jgi:hypothetical protein
VEPETSAEGLFGEVPRRRILVTWPDEGST